MRVTNDPLTIAAAVAEAGPQPEVANDALAIAAAVADAGPQPEVVIEATYGWYWMG